MTQYFLKNLNVQVKEPPLILNPDTSIIYDTFTVSGWPIGTTGMIYIAPTSLTNMMLTETFAIKKYLTTDTSVVITYDDLKLLFTYAPTDDNDNGFIYSVPAYIKTDTQSSYLITYTKSLSLSSLDTTIYNSFTVSGWPIGTEGTIYLNLPYQVDQSSGGISTLNILVKSYSTTDTSVVVTYDDLLQNDILEYFDSNQECYVITNYNQRLPYPILFKPLPTS
jgi:hypothetical protein